MARAKARSGNVQGEVMLGTEKRPVWCQEWGWDMSQERGGLISGGGVQILGGCDYAFHSR